MKVGDTVLCRGTGGVSPAMIKKHRGGALPLAFIMKLVARGILELLVSDDGEQKASQKRKPTLDEQVAAEVDEAISSEA